MSKLPFLEPKVWPRLRKLSGVSKYGFSEDDDLVELALSELMQAIENKDHSKFMEALGALIECILNKEQSGVDDGPDSFKETLSV